MPEITQNVVPVTLNANLQFSCTKKILWRQIFFLADMRLNIFSLDFGYCIFLANFWRTEIRRLIRLRLESLLAEKAKHHDVDYFQLLHAVICDFAP